MFVPQCHYWCWGRGPVPCPQALLPTGAPCTPDPALAPQPALGRGLGPSPLLPVPPGPIHPGQELSKGRCTRFNPWALYGLLDDLLEPANAVWSIMPRKAYPSACAFPNHWYSSDKKIRVGNGGLTGLDSSIHICIYIYICIFFVALFTSMPMVYSALLPLLHLFCDFTRMQGVLSFSICIWKSLPVYYWHKLAQLFSMWRPILSSRSQEKVFLRAFQLGTLDFTSQRDMEMCSCIPAALLYRISSGSGDRKQGFLTSIWLIQD